MAALWLAAALLATACTDGTDSSTDEEPVDGEPAAGLVVEIDKLDTSDLDCLYRPDLLLTKAGVIAERRIVDGDGQLLAGALNANDLLEREVLSIAEENRGAAVELLLGAVDVWRVADPDQVDSLQLAHTLQSQGDADGVEATPVLAFQVAFHWSFAPGSERTELADGDLASVLEATATQRDLAERVNVAVIDTGGIAGGEALGMPLLDPTVDEEAFGPGDPYQWHGVFVGGAVRTANPDTAALMVRLGPTTARTLDRLHHGEEALDQQPGDLGSFVSDELQLLHAVARVAALGDSAPPVLNVSGGTYGCGELGVEVDTDIFAPVGEAAAVDLWLGDPEQNPEQIPARTFVAAAGNDSETDPDGPHFFPSAVPKVIGVASINGGGVMSLFSNKGDVCAPGDGLVGFTPDGTVAWSGTSFAAPAMAGWISAKDPMTMGPEVEPDDDPGSCGGDDTLLLQDTKLSACANLEAPSQDSAGPNPEIGAAGVECDRIP